ncbi:MAG: hypothetical protein ACI9K2_007542, partial [Myxococcota bacterium]
PAIPSSSRILLGLLLLGAGCGGNDKAADSADPCALDPEIAWGVATATCGFTEDDFLDPDEDDPTDNTLTIGARVRICDDATCTSDLRTWAEQYDGCFADDVANSAFAANVLEILGECD